MTADRARVLTLTLLERCFPSLGVDLGLLIRIARIIRRALDLAEPLLGVARAYWPCLPPDASACQSGALRSALGKATGPPATRRWPSFLWGMCFALSVSVIRLSPH